ncbi:MAG: hypothetical protein ABFR33_03905 [Verrucomicrobiota bacterium]
MKNIGLILCTALLLSEATAKVAGDKTPPKKDYRVGDQLGKGKLGRISQITMGADDTLHVLDNNGKVTVFDADGEMAKTIETGMGNTTAIAVSPDGNIHVFSTLTETKKVKSGARMRTVHVPIGVECGIFDPSGKSLEKKTLKNLKSAKAARFIGDTLAVADLTARAVVLMDAESGEETGRIKKGLRLCCGIFDFCEGPDNTIAISNLGAFKLQRFDLDGDLVSEFGKRGRGIDDFQGCCNPVSAGYLPDGRIVTVEKDPTRIKIYGAKGRKAEKIEGVEELVKGCSFIPVAVDSKNNIYLASSIKGCIVKCVPKK